MTFATLRDALAALPVGAEAIADHLTTLGVRGSCNEPAICAIAEYLTATVDIADGLYVRVSNKTAALYLPGVVPAATRCWFTPVGDDSVHVDRPDIREFIANFDLGMYPALVGGSYAQVAA
jgi:hypothetical protein